MGNSARFISSRPSPAIRLACRRLLPCSISPYQEATPIGYLVDKVRYHKVVHLKSYLFRGLRPAYPAPVPAILMSNAAPDPAKRCPESRYLSVSIPDRGLPVRASRLPEAMPETARIENARMTDYRICRNSVRDRIQALW